MHEPPAATADMAVLFLRAVGSTSRKSGVLASPTLRRTETCASGPSPCGCPVARPSPRSRYGVSCIMRASCQEFAFLRRIGRKRFVSQGPCSWKRIRKSSLQEKNKTPCRVCAVKGRRCLREKPAIAVAQFLQYRAASPLPPVNRENSCRFSSCVLLCSPVDRRPCYCKTQARCRTSRRLPLS